MLNYQDVDARRRSSMLSHLVWNDAKPAMVCSADDMLGWSDFPKGLRVLLLDEDSLSSADLKSKLEEMDYIGIKKNWILLNLLATYPSYSCSTTSFSHKFAATNCIQYCLLRHLEAPSSNDLFFVFDIYNNAIFVIYWLFISGLIHLPISNECGTSVFFLSSNARDW